MTHTATSPAQQTAPALSVPRSTVGGGKMPIVGATPAKLALYLELLDAEFAPKAVREGV